MISFELISDPLVMLAVLAGLLANLIISLWARSTRANLPIAYNVALFGFSRVGKTTLITTLFAELFSSRSLGVQAAPRGGKTIERVNEDMRRLELGQVLGPTMDQDLFAYRLDLKSSRRPVVPFLSRRLFKVSIGDFPGERTEELENDEWYHDTEYFKWAMEADAFVYVFDLALIFGSSDSLRSERYVAKSKAAARASWNLLNEYHFESARDLRNKPVVLVFTKLDALLPGADKRPTLAGSRPSEDLERLISKFAFGERPYRDVEIPEHLIEETTRAATEKYADLCEFFEKETRRSQVIVVSCFGKSDGQRVGIDKLLSAILPR